MGKQRTGTQNSSDEFPVSGSEAQILTQAVRRKKMKFPWTSLAVQWLRICASNAGAQVQFLVRKPRSCKAHSAAKKQTNKQQEKQTKHTHTQHKQKSFKLFLKGEK